MKLDKNKEYALALSGGGLRGAYEIGVVKALYEDGIKIKAICGTSAGSLNAALLAMGGNIETAEKVWSSMAPELIYNTDDGILNMVRDISKLEGIIKDNVDVNTLKNSDIDWGVVTFNVSTRKPVIIFNDEMEEDRIIDYVLASANYPVFYRQKIGDDKYMDGGIYDNLPSKPLYDRGYKDIIEVDINPPLSMVTRKKLGDDATVHYITSKHSLLGQFLFTNDDLIENLNKGYWDAKLYNEDYISSHYYVKAPKGSIAVTKEDLKQFVEDPVFKSILENDLIGIKYYNSINNYFNEKNGFEGNIEVNDDMFFMGMLEITADMLGIEKLREYEYGEFIDEILLAVENLKKDEETIRDIMNGKIFKLIEEKVTDLSRRKLLAALLVISKKHGLLKLITYRTRPKVTIAYVAAKILLNRQNEGSY